MSPLIKVLFPNSFQIERLTSSLCVNTSTILSHRSQSLNRRALLLFSCLCQGCFHPQLRLQRGNARLLRLKAAKCFLHLFLRGDSISVGFLGSSSNWRLLINLSLSRFSTVSSLKPTRTSLAPLPLRVNIVLNNKEAPMHDTTNTCSCDCGVRATVSSVTTVSHESRHD